VPPKLVLAPEVKKLIFAPCPPKRAVFKQNSTIMTRSVSVLLLLLFASISLIAQEKVKKVARPDIPGSFILDFGFNRGSHVPANFKQSFWGARTINLYYQYPIRILKSHFSVNPGIGSSFERFKLTNAYTLNPTHNDDGTYSLVSASDLHVGSYKSMIVTNYFEIPIDLRFDTNPEDRARSFSVAVGGRVGVLYDGFTKIKYKEEGIVKEIKDKQDHGLNKFRYGIYGRIGGGAFNFFTFYNLSPYFTNNKGPDRTTMNTLTIGISVNGF
jgi:hypothetical protein